MTRAMSAVGGAVSLLVGLTLGESCAASPSDQSYVKVEIRGQLLRAGPDGPTGIPVVKAESMTIELQFKDQPTPAGKLQGLFNQRVIVRGILRKPGPDRLVCVVEGDVVADTQASRDAQYLVGYQEGQEGTVESLCRGLGLKVVDRYEPGKYLVVEPTEQADEKFLEKLKGSRTVRYVEKNMEVRIPEPKG